ncbi:hypothetical protein CERSUDRAFT_117486 [Gelatoporia subvermispora B]|uniref:DUF647-domain-containing protein n=1 Tax=Ceriporiopsis subvermispora (strain B) TaxID=914234 RepID=M2R4Z8_CERS8|nr:hypothetical protein CERSUDRAFT_117486 [Gelatoporia subvermispora B]
MLYLIGRGHLSRTSTRTLCSRLSLPAQHHGTSCRHKSTHSRSHHVAVDAQTVAEPTAQARPFAIERIGGRECHVSWSEDSGVEKEWRELSQPTEAEERAISSSGTFVGRLSAWFRQMFLPTNYPQSVHRSYMPFHVLQFVEGTLGTLVSVLCNQALLTSVGVSAEGSIFGAVAVQWIIKDGAGEVAKLFFIRKFSPYFDSHPKTFTLSGEVLVALGSGLQMATLLVNPTPLSFLICAAGGNAFKLIGYAIWFTTHIKFIRYFSQQGNTGDVAAKDESQASVAQLAGYAAGIGLLTLSHDPSYLYTIFALAVPTHLVATTLMMRCATFELLTIPRLSLLAETYSRKGDVMPLSRLEAKRATGMFGEFYGKGQGKLVSLAPRVAEVVKDEEGERARWALCTEVCRDERYLLYPPAAPQANPASVFLRPDASSDDMLRAVLHAARLRSLLADDIVTLREALKDSHEWTQEHFMTFKGALDDKGWRTDEVAFADQGHRLLWGAEAERAL